MAKYGSDQVKIEVQNAAAEYVDISAEILDMPGVDIEAMTEEGHGFGEDWVMVLATGLSKVGDMTLKGFYDDTAAKTHALFNRVGLTSNIKITWGGAKTTAIPVLIKNYKRLPTRGELTKFEATLIANGEPVEA